jgi:hypothetical protein
MLQHLAHHHTVPDRFCRSIRQDIPAAQINGPLNAEA